jgi:uncharacterized membrane protein
MTIILIIVGTLLGSFFFSRHGFGNELGFLPGALLGYLLSAILNLRKQIATLQKDIKEIQLLAASRTEQKSADRQYAGAAVSTPHTSTLPQAESINTSVAEKSVSPVDAAIQPHTKSAAPVTPVPVQTQATTQTNKQTPLRPTLIRPVDDPAIIRYLREYFSGPNLLVRVGVIVLFFGVAFLLKYAAERTHLPIELRLMGVIVGAMVMLVIGWRLRTRLEDYALVMQGGAIGVIYLTVFSALRLFAVLEPAYALIILTAVGIFSAILAVLQNARSLAILGICGGFLAPILTSTGEGNHVVLFSYYALLNAGIFGMAWFKAWRPLNLLGFAFTFVISTFWGVTRYHAADFASTEPFLILFFLFYVGIAVMYANRQSPDLKNYVDGTLVFGTPIIAFGLQAGMMQQQEMLQIFEYGLSVSAVVLSLFYVTLAKILFERKRDSLRMLVESFLALSIVFATLAIPLALDGRWTAGAWALEGAAVLWMGVRQNRVLARVFGSLLQFAAGFALLTDYRYHETPLAILNSVYIGAVLVSFAGLFSAWFMQRKQTSLSGSNHTALPLPNPPPKSENLLAGHPREGASAPLREVNIYEFELPLAYALFAWGVLWWLGSGLREIEHFVSREYQSNAALLFFTFTSMVFSMLHRRLAWPLAMIPALGLLPAMVLVTLVQIAFTTHPFAHAGFICWPISFAMLYWILRRHENDVDEQAISIFHMVTLWLLAFLLSTEVAWAINHVVQGKGTWPLIAWALVPGLVVGGLSLRGPNIRWPVAAHLHTYLGVAALPLAAFLWLWSLFTNFNSNGDPYPISYLPLLNPLDLAQIFVFIVLATWLIKVRLLGIPILNNIPREGRFAAMAGTVFVWLNAALLRTLHYWADVPFNTYSMMHSVLVQTCLAIFWSVLAMALMRYASQKKQRAVWMVGGALMGAVVLKLFTVDISSRSSLEGIISFIGVAVLMLIIGYIAPLPAKQEASKHA